MGSAHYDGTFQVIGAEPGALTTTAILEGTTADLVFHIGDISYARGYANVVSELISLLDQDTFCCP